MLLVAGAALVWSSGGLLARMIGTDPWTKLFWRSVFAFVFLLAYAWLKNSVAEEGYGAKLVNSAIRVKDPCVHFHGHWLVRRMAPDCSRIELSSLPKERDELRLLYDMGWETANMHFGSPKAISKIRRDLASRRGRWLHKAAKVMYKATLADWQKWRRGSKYHAK